MPTAMLIYNPVAGRYPSRLLTERAAHILQKNGWRVWIETTHSGEHIAQLARQAVAEDMDALVVVGGDGSLNRALPALLGKRTALGVLPAGTANVWAQELSLPGLTWTRLMALEESAHRLFQAQIREVDVGLCNGIPFLLWAGVGLDAFIVHRIEPRKPWEKNLALAHYAAKAVWQATIWHGMNLRVRTDSEQLSGQFTLAVVSNIRLYAGGLARLSPYALMDDGIMDLWLFEGSSLEDTVKQAWNLWSGRHLHSERVQCIPFKRITLESDSPLFVQLDGEPERGNGSIAIEVLTGAVRILVPDGTSSTLFEKPAFTVIGK